MKAFMSSTAERVIDWPCHAATRERSRTAWAAEREARRVLEAAEGHPGVWTDPVCWPRVASLRYRPGADNYYAEREALRESLVAFVEA